jgi:hypothetical protein
MRRESLYPLLLPISQLKSTSVKEEVRHAAWQELEPGCDLRGLDRQVRCRPPEERLNDKVVVEILLLVVRFALDKKLMAKVIQEIRRPSWTQ